MIEALNRDQDISHRLQEDSSKPQIGKPNCNQHKSINGKHYITPIQR